MTEVTINKQARLSEHLTSPSVATLGNSNKLDGARCSKSLKDEKMGLPNFGSPNYHLL